MLVACVCVCFFKYSLRFYEARGDEKQYFPWCCLVGLNHPRTPWAPELCSASREVSLWIPLSAPHEIYWNCAPPSIILPHHAISVFLFFMWAQALTPTTIFLTEFFRSMFNFRCKKDALQSISNLFKKGVTRTTGERHQPFTPVLMLRLCKWHARLPIHLLPWDIWGDSWKIFVRQWVRYFAWQLILNDKKNKSLPCSAKRSLLSSLLGELVLISFES